MAPKHVDPRKVKYFEDRAAFLLHKCKPEEKADFVLQTFNEISKDGWSVCTNGKVATNVEKMMPFATAEATGCIIKAFSKEMDSVFNTKFAHHVLHAAIRHCANNPELRQDELISSCISDYLDFMWENYPTFLQHPHGAPALRIYIQLLSGVMITKSTHTGLYEVDKVTLTEPLDPSYTNRITDFANKFLLSDQFNAFVVDAITSPFLQTLLIICWKCLEADFGSICSHILRKSNLLKPNDTGDTLNLHGQHQIQLPMGFSNPVAVFFLETLISVLPGKLLQKLIRKNLLTYTISKEDGEVEVPLASALSGHGNACRVLRAAVRAVKRIDDIQAILSALEKPGPSGDAGLLEALNSGQHYLLTVLATASRKQNSEAVQFTFEKMILETFGYPLKAKKTDDQLIKSIVRLKRRDTASPEVEGEEVGTTSADAHKTSCNLAGCLLAEEMLTFTYHRPTRLAASLACLAGPDMFAWARHQMLHRVLEAALLSPSVPAERKVRIFSTLKPQLGPLAMDASGSRVVEAVWRATDSFLPETTGRSTKEEIAETLAPLAERLASSKFGRFVEHLVASSTYRTNRERWRQAKLGVASANKKGQSAFGKRPPSKPLQRQQGPTKRQKR
uniref:PUM-HD domain-containing protein n=2 Tax=Mesocestoides corti TaxID=53468 RepID=A0A5K3FXI4_MESCO